MARKNRIVLNRYAYHIYARCNNRTSFGVPQSVAWDIYSSYLYFITNAYYVRVHAFSLMPNHFHLLCSFPKENMSAAMRYFMTETGRAMNLVQGTINHIYGGRFKSTLISQPDHYLIAYKYVLQNPLRAGLTKDLCEYPYTSLAGCLGSRKLLIPIQDNLNGLASKIPICYLDQLDWLHVKVADDSLDIVRKSFCRREFKIPKEEGTGKERVINF